MYNRYLNNQQIINNSELYEQFLKKRNLKNLLQYSTFDFGNLKEIRNADIDIIYHTVQPFEKLYNISQKYYNAPEYGWLICYTNKIPSELEINIGDILMIYSPLGSVLELL